MKATLSVCKCILAFCRQLQTKAESQHQSPTSSDSNGLAVISIVSATLISTLPSDFLLFRCTTRLFRFYKEQSKELCRFFFKSTPWKTQTYKQFVPYFKASYLQRRSTVNSRAEIKVLLVTYTYNCPAVCVFRRGYLLYFQDVDRPCLKLTLV